MTDDESVTSRTQPALRTLQLDQRELLEGGETVSHGLRDGFPTRRAALEWYQRATTRTLGYLAAEVEPIDLVRDRTLVGSLVVGPERTELVDDPPRPAVAKRYRRVLERAYVRPACNRSYDRLRRGAGEYLEDSDVSPAKVDPSQQGHVAMRPTIARKDIEQAAALRELWGGFETEDELLDWLHDLDEPANGQVPSDLAARLGKDATARAHLIASEQADVRDAQARRYREHIAAAVVLPAFCRGVDRLESAGELVEQQSSGLTAPQG